MADNITWTEYTEFVDLILNNENPPEPYNDAEYLHYAKMNRERGDRWLKTFQPLPETVEAFAGIKKKQNWVLITEPWCGDAAHVNPIVYLLSELNENISLNIQLRDSNSEIENYLTNGTLSIPKLVIRDAEGNDLSTWGPRPEGAKKLFTELREQGAAKEEYIVALQKWYNADKTQSIQRELSEIVKGIQ